MQVLVLLTPAGFCAIARGFAPALWAALALALAGCGGNSGARAGAVVLSPPAGEANAQPTFHLAPVQLDEPSDLDADGSGSSAHLPPHTQAIPPALLGLDTAGLTPEAIAQRLGAAGQFMNPDASSGGQTITVFTPAQIRSAYELPALPASTAKISATQVASLGSGQTIYLIDAYDNPNAASDLAIFNATFGLPTCTSVPITPGTKLPLAAPQPEAGCTFSVAYVGESGLPAVTAPSYSAAWATEIAIDVQWAHATAPLARIVLLEAQGAAVTQLVAAIELASRMGPGIVSMSFGASEGSWETSYDAIFATAHNAYVASTGDSGAGVNWPSVSPNVLAVGGTTLTYTGTGSRSESAWSRTGGGLSAFEAEPSYQAAVSVPGDAKAGSGAHAMRGVADVSFNADPNTGQYLVVTTPGARTATWYCAGGTSLAAPQWAGLLAITNAQRTQADKLPLGLAQVPLYDNIGAVKGLYAGAFLDVTHGSDGRCAICSAGPGYDLPTGLGTPNATDLLGLLLAD